MATLKKVIEEGRLIKFKALMDVGQLEHRIVYMTPEARDWCYSSGQLGYISPNPKSFKEVRAALSDFTTGCVLYLDVDIKRLRNKNDDIWEIKSQPPDAVRLFGWFYRPSIFILSHCEYRSKIKNFNSHIKKVKYLSNELGFFRDKDFKWCRDEKKYFDI